ncbi:MAG: RNA 2',3'-cyclic phosphodiesterase [Steroidobacteraceae bacterium]|nr:RNA 2',3'-cyclic phosphodiesterase [Steroidobacteraceae bacterium]MDW8259756.1 RNA 2',3'-cyclic phosphodiesterase [Gammaproteobacteria bacterium]
MTHPSPSLRLFFALWPPAPTRLALARSARLYLATARRPVATQRLHMTVAFLGRVAPERLATLRALAGTVRAAPFVLRLDRIGYWRRSRLLCLVPSGTPAALEALVRDLRVALRQQGFRIDTRPFAPHVTVAREVIHAPPRSAPPEVRWPVRSFVLVESRTGGLQSQYTVLARWRLRDS